jgi:hypothetical protein
MQYENQRYFIINYTEHSQICVKVYKGILSVICLTESISGVSSCFKVTIVLLWLTCYLFCILYFTFYTVTFPAVVYSGTLTRICEPQCSASWFRRTQLQFPIFPWWMSLITQFPQMMFFWKCMCHWKRSHAPVCWFSTCAAHGTLGMCLWHTKIVAQN